MDPDSPDLAVMPRRSQAYSLYGLRWGAVLAGVAVGVAIHMLLTLAGTAVLGTFAASGAVAPDDVAVAAAGWNTAGMLLAAFIGGYIAARSSGLRRTADGVLHGVVSWGATTLLFALLSNTGINVSGMFSGAGAGGAGVRLLLDSAEFAWSVPVHAVTLLYSAADSSSVQQVEAIRNAAAASAWSGLGILLSLLSAIGGGAAGAHGSRRHPTARLS